jgi:hypothetical protein
MTEKIFSETFFSIVVIAIAAVLFVAKSFGLG